MKMHRFSILAVAAGAVLCGGLLAGCNKSGSGSADAPGIPNMDKKIDAPDSKMDSKMDKTEAPDSKMDSKMDKKGGG